ncbi:protein MIGRI [Leeia oryzae]|uniref:protein MIGRI n=1 Tax=Leeia oryzae TaxID=356662 RepID=UPI000374589D|nr:hypothetical protein [Leeia oryzae]
MLIAPLRYAGLLLVVLLFVVVYVHLFSPRLRKTMRGHTVRIAWVFVLASAAYMLVKLWGQFHPPR